MLGRSWHLQVLGAGLLGLRSGGCPGQLVLLVLTTAAAVEAAAAALAVTAWMRCLVSCSSCWSTRSWGR